MITDKAGTPIAEVLKMAALRKAERDRYRKPVPCMTNSDGHRIYRVLKDKLGDPYRVYRYVWRV